MDTIFTLLIILLPIVFKLIGKKLENAGTQPQAADQPQEPIEDWAEVVRRHIEAQQRGEVTPAAPVQTPPVQATTVQEKMAQEGKPQTRKATKPAAQVKKPILQEEEKKRTEKIDKKKLIVYSEIMKPKYTE